jgi:hypothetical protein
MDARLRLPVLIATFALLFSAAAFAQGTKPAPKTAKPPAKAAPATKKPPAAPAAAVPAPPPPPTDVRYKTKYTTGSETTESVTFISNQRERYELGDIVLIKQRDQQRNVQISRAANTYVIVADTAPPAAAAVDPARPPGVVTVTISVVDLGERKDAFGQTARRVRTVMQREPQPGACDQSKVLTQTDAWYIDMPKVLAAAPDTNKTLEASGCADEITTAASGDTQLIGFPISYRATLTDLTDKDAKPMESAMEITEFEVLKLDAALFDIPPGLTAAADPREFTKAISDTNETRLARGAAESIAPAKQPGTLRVGVPETGNKTTQSADTRALRARIISELEQQKIDAIPMAAGSPAELDARARELGVDYLVLSEITELRVSKPGGFTKVLKATAKEEARDITEAKLNVQLLPVGGKPRLSKNASGKDGGVGLKTGLKVAKFAGNVYLKFYMGGMMAGQLSAFSSLQMMNMGGMGNMGSMMSMGAGGRVDRTAGAANYVMQQVMAGAASGSQSGPSFDAALENAIEDAGKDVVESLKRLPASKK